MSEPRRHHVLAETYLYQFSLDAKVVCVWDKVENRIFPTQPKNVSAIRDYNTVQSEDGSQDRSTVESFFNKFESGYPERISQLTSGFQTAETINNCIQFIYIQAMRSPVVRNLMTEILLQLSPKDQDLQTKLGLDQAAIGLIRRARNGEKTAKKQLGLQSSGHFAIGLESILSKLWYRPIRVENGYLSTSDNPVVHFGLNKTSKGYVAGSPIGDNRIICCIALSHDILFVGDSAPPARDAFLTERASQVTNSKPLVGRYNELVAAAADRIVVAPTMKQLRNFSAKRLDQKVGAQKLQKETRDLGRVLIQLNQEHWN